MTRTDEHRPSVINTADYEYVGQNCIRIDGASDCEALLEMRRRIREHMTRTGGTYSGHEHGGSCGICGNVNAIYTVVFYHKPSNTYLITGSDCALKLDWQDDGSFRKSMKHYLEFQTGKKRAFGILAEMEAGAAWTAYELPYEQRTPDQQIMADMVNKLIKYGSFSSDRQQNFLMVLVKRNSEEAIRRRAEERNAAAPCPVGRVIVTGKVLKIKEQENQFGAYEKMLVKAEEGYMVWVTVPGAYAIGKGDTVKFAATLEQSKDDSKFGFGSRPVMKAHTPVTPASEVSNDTAGPDRV